MPAPRSHAKLATNAPSRVIAVTWCATSVLSPPPVNPSKSGYAGG